MTWPSTFDPGTKGYMKDRIDDEIKRSGTLTTRIDQCILSAIAIYQRHRFRFNEGIDYSFSTVIDQEYYSAATAAAAGSGGIGTGFVPYEFDYLAIVIGNARFELQRKQPKDIDLLTQSGTQKGQPQSYSYFNEQFRLYPVPSAVYSIIVSGHEILAAPAAGTAGDSTASNRWMTDGERLIRCRAKYELSTNYNIDFPALAQRMNPDTGETADAYWELRREAAKITGTGRFRPTQF